MTLSLVALRCRTSDRTSAGVRGAEELALLVGKRLGSEPRMIGTAGAPREARFDEDLSEGRGCLLEAGGQVDDALAAGQLPVLLAAECSIALTTLGTALGHRPEARVLWLDAHGDFNTPETSYSGILAGMPVAILAGLAGPLWRGAAGLAAPIPTDRILLAGVRELDEKEATLLAEMAAQATDYVAVQSLDEQLRALRAEKAAAEDAWLTLSDH